MSVTIVDLVVRALPFPASLRPRVARAFSGVPASAIADFHPYLGAFVFRSDRRRNYRSAFDMLLGIGLKTGPMCYGRLVGRLAARQA